MGIQDLPWLRPSFRLETMFSELFKTKNTRNPLTPLPSSGQSNAGIIMIFF